MTSRRVRGAVGQRLAELQLRRCRRCCFKRHHIPGLPCGVVNRSTSPHVCLQLKAHMRLGLQLEVCHACPAVLTLHAPTSSSLFARCPGAENMTVNNEIKTKTITSSTNVIGKRDARARRYRVRRFSAPRCCRHGRLKG